MHHTHLSVLQVSPCHDFLKDLLDTVLTKKQSSLVAADKQLKEPYTAPGYTEPPQRRTDINFTRYSWVLQHNLTCYPTAPCQYRTPSDCPKGRQLLLLVKAMMLRVRGGCGMAQELHHLL